MHSNVLLMLRKIVVSVPLGVGAIRIYSQRNKKINQSIIN